MVHHGAGPIVVLILLLGGFAPAVFTNQSAPAAPATNVQPRSPLPDFDAALATSLSQITDLLNRGRGNEAEALASQVLTRVEEVRGVDSLEAARVLDLFVRAVRRSARVTDEEKARLAERAVAIKERLLDPWDPDLAISLINLAIQRTLAADPASAKPLLERALAIRERAFGQDDLSVAATLGSLAGVLMTMRDDAGAKTLVERTLAIQEARYGAAHIETIRTMIRIASFYVEVTDFVGARRHYERALSLARQTLDANHPLVFGVRLRLAIVFSEGLGDYTASARLNEELIVDAETSFGPADPRLIVPLRNLALDRRDLGEYRDAKALAERSLAIAERRFGSKHPDVADSLHTLATVLAAQGAYSEALQAFERATRINEEIRRPPDPELGRASWFIQELLPVSGYDADDTKLFEQAAAIRERTTGLADYRATESLANLAAMLSNVEDYKRTRPLFERALVAQETALGPDHPTIAAAAANLARVLEHTGDVAAARALYERALHISEKAFGPDHPNVAMALVRLAGLPSTSDEDDSLLLRRALAIQEKALGSGHPDVAETLGRLATLEARSGATADALETAARAEAIRQEHLALTARTLSERQALAYASSESSALDVMLSVAAKSRSVSQTSTLTWNAVIRARGMVLDEMAARHRVASRTEDPEIVALTQALAAARQKLASAVVRGIRNEPPERYRRLLDQARSEKERAERSLAEKSVPFRESQARGDAALPELSAALPPESALVAFVRYRRHHLEPAALNTVRDPDREPSYLAFVLRGGDRMPAVVPIGSAVTVDRLVLQWRQQLNQEAMAGGRATTRSEAAYQRIAAQLREQVWDPLLPSLSNAKRVFIVPDGALHLVSFAALPTTTSRYLVETGPLIHYLSTERDLVRTDGRLAGGSLLALGSPAYDELGPARARSDGAFRGPLSGCGDFQSMRFDPLPASLKEIDDVTRLWNQAQGTTTRLIGAAASEAAFKAQAAGRRVLHLATHGFFLGGRCSPTPDATTASPAAESSAKFARENPLLLSGLILAGANQRNVATPDQEDGVLTAEEVAALDLNGLEWAVLSGCETGVGEIRIGEGVFGLRRAFQVAGARTVIMSLWQVGDQTTHQWMTTLYEGRLMKRLSTANAVREASLAVLRQRRANGLSSHPFYWAGFVASGDWR